MPEARVSVVTTKPGTEVLFSVFTTNGRACAETICESPKAKLLPSHLIRFHCVQTSQGPELLQFNSIA